MALSGKKRRSGSLLSSPPPPPSKPGAADGDSTADAAAGPGTPTGYTLKEEKEIIAFAKRLAANDKAARDQAIKRLEHWMARHKALAEGDLLKIWKGLFYCMWMADKAAVQEALARSIARLVHCLGEDLGRARLFVRAFYKTVRREWAGLDQHRLDKFYAFMRTMLRECLAFAKRRQWAHAALAAVVLPLETEVLAHPWPNGLRLHLCDLALPELARVGQDGVSTEQAVRVLRPFLAAAATSEDRIVAERARARVLLDFVEKRREEAEGGKEAFLPGVDAEELQATVFDLAAAEGTRERYRPALYEAHKAFQGLTGKKRAGEGVASHVGLVFGQDTASAAAQARLEAQGQKEEAAAAALAAKQEAKEKVAAKAAAAGAVSEAAAPKQQGQKRKAASAAAAAVEAAAAGAKSGAEKKGTETAKAGTLETPFGEGVELSGLSKAQRKKMKKGKEAGAADGKQQEKLQKKEPEVEVPVPSSSASSKKQKKTAAAAAATAATEQAERKSGSGSGAAAVGKAAQEKKRKLGGEEAKGAADAGEKQQQQQQQQQKKKKAKQQQQATPVPAAAMGGAATEKEKEQEKPKAPVEFIAAKRFAGAKPGYAFKKGANGVGYYVDAVQTGGGSKAPNQQQQKRVRFGKVQVKLFNKHEVRLPPNKKSLKGTVSFMGNGGGGGGGGRGGAGKRGGRGGGRGGHNGNRRKAVSYF